jgi:hypothetical protein
MCHELKCITAQRRNCAKAKPAFAKATVGKARNRQSAPGPPHVNYVTLGDSCVTLHRADEPTLRTKIINNNLHNNLYTFK